MTHNIQEINSSLVSITTPKYTPQYSTNAALELQKSVRKRLGLTVKNCHNGRAAKSHMFGCTIQLEL